MFSFNHHIRRGLGLAGAMLAVAVLACERRIEEPVAPVTTVKETDNETTQPTASASGATSSRKSPAEQREAQRRARLAGRCVRPMPAQPHRPEPPRLDPKCPTDPPEPFELASARVVFEQRGLELTVEVARRLRHRERGLMYRRSLADSQGMLFVFPNRQNQRFWMRNTCVPLDMLFIDSDGLIVGIEENVPTMNDYIYQVGCPSVFVLEVAAGWARRHNVKSGQFVRIGKAKAKP